MPELMVEVSQDELEIIEALITGIVSGFRELQDAEDESFDPTFPAPQYRLRQILNNAKSLVSMIERLGVTN